ncbi:MAG: HEAT repeat domain-containing protein, partial [Kiritimatiellaeota bacterium]|nr:HEAT repeat domain-containing protein [Kiritimatiellota bacterium]
MNIIHRSLLLAVVCAASSVFAQSPETKLLAVLKSDAPRPEKVDACRELAHVGTKEAVAPLAALLGDEQFAHMARYGLENIPDSAAAAALRAALDQLKGKFLVGVIASLGVLRDAQSVAPLAALLGDADADVAAAAAMALGKIGSDKAVAALKPVLGKNPAAAEAVLRCAEASPDQAVALYDAVRAAPVLAYQKMAATRGAILARGAAGLPLLLEQLRSNDPASLKVALGVGRELPGAEVTQALAAEIGKFAP